MVNRERVSLSDYSERLGRWLMSTRFFFRSGLPLYEARPGVVQSRHPPRRVPGPERYLE